MLYVIDNGESYSDRWIYFIRVPVELDSDANIVEDLLVKTLSGVPHCMLRASAIEWRSPTAFTNFEAFVDQGRFFVVVADDHVGPTYVMTYTRANLPPVKAQIIPNERLWEIVTPRILDHLLRGWGTPKDDYTGSHTSSLLLEAAKRWGPDWRDVLNYTVTDVKVDRFEREFEV